MIWKLFEWFDERLGAAGFARKTLRKVFPDHWSFMLGEIALYCFIILVITGIFLTFFYIPSQATVVYHGPYRPLDGQSMSVAYESTLALSFQVKLGLLFRQIHHWAAILMTGAIAVHALRVFFTGAYRKPREVNWMIGTTLLVLTIAIGFAGYSLPDDLLSGTGLRIAYSIALSIPVIGTWLAFLLFGGAYPAPDILGRLFILHVLILPLVIAGLIGAHLGLLWRQKHTNFPRKGLNDDMIRGERIWPRYAFKSAGLFFIVFAVCAGLGGLVQINPIWLYGPYSPIRTTGAAQPDWYMGWVEGLVRLWPSWEFRGFGYEIPEPFVPGIVMPGLLFTTMALWPFIEQRITKDRRHHNLLQLPREAPGRTALGVAAVTFASMITIVGGSDVISSLLGISIETFTEVMRGVTFGLPVVAYAVTYYIARELSEGRLHPVRRSSIVTLRRLPTGGFESVEEERGGFQSTEERLEHAAAGGEAEGHGQGREAEEALEEV